MAINAYAAIAHKSLDEMSRLVSSMLIDTWQPHGPVLFNPVTAEYVQTLIQQTAEPAGDGGGLSKLVELQDFEPGSVKELGAGDIPMIVSGSQETGFTWTNIGLAAAIEDNVAAQFSTRRLNYVDPASPTALQDLVNLLVLKAWMAPAG